jgi:Rrf2 family nitric oxide-sensitive transcriptional repressor
MRLSKTTSHAIRILIDCTEADGALVKVADIARRLDITPVNAFKIVHILSRAGFVEAARGRYGGVGLARPATSIRIGDIVREIEATEMEVAGAARAAASGDREGKPPLNMIFDDALEAFISVLDRHSLADMAKSSRAAPPLPAEAPRKTRRRPAKAVTRGSAVIRG